MGVIPLILRADDVELSNWSERRRKVVGLVIGHRIESMVHRRVRFVDRVASRRQRGFDVLELEGFHKACFDIDRANATRKHKFCFLYKKNKQKNKGSILANTTFKSSMWWCAGSRQSGCRVDSTYLSLTIVYVKQPVFVIRCKLNPVEEPREWGV